MDRQETLKLIAQHPLRKVNKRYTELLNKFSSDPDFTELLEQLTLDKSNEEMVTYMVTGQYPEPIKELDKLKNDLYTVISWNRKKMMK